MLGASALLNYADEPLHMFAHNVIVIFSNCVYTQEALGIPESRGGGAKKAAKNLHNNMQSNFCRINALRTEHPHINLWKSIQ